MKKGIIRTLLMALAFVILSLPGQARAGHDMGSLSKENPSVNIKFTLTGDEDFYGGFFTIKGAAENCYICIEKLTAGDAPITVQFANVSNGFDEIGSYTFKKGNSVITEKLPDLKDQNMYFIQIEKPDLGGLSSVDLGVSVYSKSLGGSGYDYTGEAKAATKLTLSQGELVLVKKGQKAKLDVTLDKSLSKKGVKWSTSNKKVATVDKNGKITAKGYGTAIITCTSKKSKKYAAKCTVKVEKPSVELPLGYKFPAGRTGKISATVKPYGANVIWSSSDESVFKIDQDGNYTAVFPGTASVTCTIADNKKIKAVCTITVQDEAQYALEEADRELINTFAKIVKGTCEPISQYLNNLSPSSKNDSSGNTIWSVSYQNNGTLSNVYAFDNDADKMYKTSFIRQYPCVTSTGGASSGTRDLLMKGTYDYENDIYGVIVGWNMFDTSTTKEELENMIGYKLTDELYEKLNHKYNSYSNVIVYGKNAEGVLCARYAGYVYYSPSANYASYSIYGVAEDYPDRYGQQFYSDLSY